MTAILKVDTIQDTSGNNIINENANTITIGKAGDTTNIVGTLQNDGAALISGITEADQFRLTASVTANADITANLERCDNASFGKIGTGMSESSGIFTFPSTGTYQVISAATFNGNGTTEAAMTLQTWVTINNSSYDQVVEIQNGAITTSNILVSASKSCFVNVTNTSNVKVKFAADSLSAGSSVIGDTDINKTFFTFIRLGDST